MPALYVDAEGYRRRTGDKATGTDGTLDVLIETACRAVDRELGVAPGMFAPLTSTAFRFSGDGTNVLRLRDSDGNQYLLRTITADSLAIDYDADGSFDDYLWDFNDAWLRGLPENAVTFSEAFTAVEIITKLSTAPLTAFPNVRNNIQITGTWGFPATPGAVVELVCDMVHNMRQSDLAGGIGVPLMDGALPLSNAMWPILQRLKAQYSYRIPAL